MTNLKSRSNLRYAATDVTAEARTFITHNWSLRVVQPLLIAILTTSLTAALLTLMTQMLPNQRWLLLTPILFIFTLISLFTSNWLALPEQRPLNQVAHRAAEAVVLLLLLRLLTWAISGTWPDASHFADYLRFPLIFFGGSLFIFGAIISLVAWQFASYFGTVFHDLAIDMAEATYYLLPRRERSADDKPVAIDRGELLERLFQIWISGGVIMAVLATLNTFDLADFMPSTPFAMGRLGLRPEMLIALLGYFLSGLLLLSQARLAVMKARWLRGGVRTNQTVDHSWHRASLWLVLAVALVAAFLPLGSTFAISRILQAIIFGITAVFGLLATLFLGLMAVLFQSSPPPEIVPTAEATPLPVPPMPQPVATPPSQLGDTLELVSSSAIWTIVIVVSVLSVMLILRERGVRLDMNKVKLAWGWLKVQLRLLWRGANRQVAAARQAMARQRQQVALPKPEEGKRPLRFLRLNALPPREQVRYFYLSTVRRASEQGVARRQSETPLEYARDLKEQWPDADTDVDALTDAFLRARYTPQPISPEEVNPIKAAWQHLRQQLRGKKDA